MGELAGVPADAGVADLAAAARAAVGEAAWQYLAGGSGDNVTLQRNLTAWSARTLLPRVLAGVGEPDTSAEVLGHRLAAPLLVAPTASQGLYHPDGERATVRGAAAAGVLPVVSTHASLPLSDVAAGATGPWWFQVYVQRDRGHTTELVDRARDLGASAFVLTVDLPVQAPGTRARRRDLDDDGGAVYGNLTGLDGRPRSVDPDLDPTLSWSDVEWLRSAGGLPVLVKGVLRADDAVAAVERGAAGVIVSNHGARALDRVPATVDVLGSVVAAVDGRGPVLVDGGVRRGTDIAIALALGATAVLVGRPVVWGLAVDGADGVHHVLDVLRRELATAMALLGARTVADLTADLLGPV